MKGPIGGDYDLGPRWAGDSPQPHRTNGVSLRCLVPHDQAVMVRAPVSLREGVVESPVMGLERRGDVIEVDVLDNSL